MAQVNCPHCGHRAYVRSSEQITSGIRDLYVDCNNSDCLARFVMTLSHKHDIQPPVNSDTSPKAMAAKLLSMLPQADRQEIMQQASLF